MQTPSISKLSAQGFTSQRCPVTHQTLCNMTRSFDGFHISYARYQSDYGSDTTSIVLQDRVFLVLNGCHTDDLVEAATQNGIQGCIDLFVERIDQANKLSEHRMAVGIAKDPFELQKTMLDMVGQESMDRIAAAVSAMQPL